MVAALTISLFAICIFAWAVVSPALSGPFVLDDEPNLNVLTEFNLAPSVERASEVIASGKAGPLGRPIAMATFLLNANDWPESAEGFRRVNILLHLANGLLLFLVLLRLIDLTPPTAPWAALALTSLWLVSPANTATTLYVIQRMTLLSSFFMLLGFYFYLMGRPLLADSGRRLIAIILIANALATGLGLGVLSKENAITLLLVLLAAEATLFATAEFREWRRLLLAILSLPVILIALYLISQGDGLSASYAFRDFSLPERLLTQPLALVSYAFNTLIPISANISVFHDDFPVVSDLLATPSAALALVGLLAAGSAAVVFRKKHRLAAFAVLGFFALHALEGSVVPLELYFEHRNYLGSAFVLGLAAMLVARLLESSGSRLLLGVFFAYFSLTSLVTYSISRTWGDPMMAAITWTSQRPDSVRARQFAVGFWGGQGQLSQAEKIAREGFNRNPRHLVLLLQAAQMRCASGGDVSNDMAEAGRVVEAPIVDSATFDTLDRLYEHISINRCPGAFPGDIVELIDTLHAQARVGMTDSLHAQGWFIKAKALRLRGDLPDAIAALEKSRRYSADPGLRLWQVLWLLESGKIDDARAQFERYERERTQAREEGRPGTSTLRPDHQALARVFDAIAKIEE